MSYVRSENTATTSAVSESRKSSGANDECLICCSRLEFEAVTPCTHSRKICATCAVRLCQTDSQKKKPEPPDKTDEPEGLRCPFCKHHWNHVILTKSGLSNDPWSSFDSKHLHQVARMNAFASTPEIAQNFKRLISLYCTYCWKRDKVDLRFNSMALLQGHLKSTHKQMCCMTCADHRRAWVGDLTMYNEKTLAVHLREGTPSSSTGAAIEAHPMCEFCRKRFYGRDEIYNHLERDHMNCALCRERNENHQKYFRDYDQLETHFRAKHFLCEDKGCRQSRFVVFGNDIDLRAHRLRVHRDKLTQKERKEIGTVQVDLVYRNSIREQNSDRRGRRSRRADHRTDRTPSPAPVSSVNMSPAHQNIIGVEERSHSPVSSTAAFLGGAWSEQRHMNPRAPVVASFPSLHEAHGLPSSPLPQTQAQARPVQPRLGIRQPQLLRSAGADLQQPKSAWEKPKSKRNAGKNKRARQKNKQRLQEKEKAEKEQQEQEQRRRSQDEERSRQQMLSFEQAVEPVLHDDTVEIEEVVEDEVEVEAVSPERTSRAGLPFPESCSPQQVKTRTRLMKEEMQRHLGGKGHLLKDFKQTLAQFRTGSVLASELFKTFLESFGELTADTEHLLMELISLIPDEKKRRALHTVYRASFEQGRSSPSLKSTISPTPTPTLPSPTTSTSLSQAPMSMPSPPVAAPSGFWGQRRDSVATVPSSKPRASLKTRPAPKPRVPAVVHQTWSRAPVAATAPVRQAPRPQPQVQFYRPAPPTEQAFPSLASSMASIALESQQDRALEFHHSDDEANGKHWMEFVEPIADLQPKALKLSFVVRRRVEFLVELAIDCLSALQERNPHNLPISVTDDRLRRPRFAARGVRISDLDTGIPLRNLGIEVRAIEALNKLRNDDYSIVRDWISEVFTMMSEESLYVLIDYVLTLYAHIVAGAPKRPMALNPQPAPASSSEMVAGVAASRRNRKKNKANKKQVLMHFG